MAFLGAILLGTALPLALPLGANLEYEYALYSAWLTLLFVPLTALLARSNTEPAPPKSWKHHLTQVLLAPLLGLAPGFLFFVTGQCLCSKSGWLFWMGVQWLPALALAAGFRAVATELWRRGHSRWLVATGSIASIVILSLFAAAELWFFPEKRSTSLILGFLHGPIYDEWIPLDSGVMLMRLAHALLGIALVCAGVWLRTRTQRAQFSTAIFVVAGLAAALTARQSPSIGSGVDRLSALMPEKISGPGYTLHWRRAPATGDSQHERNARRLARDAEFHVKELTEILGRENVPDLVHIFVYPDRELKKLWFGGGGTDVADVVTPSIHITAGTWPHPTLRHELVHALASDVAFHGLGFHSNMAFTEGLAVALAPEDRALPMDESAAAILSSGRLTDVEAIFSPLGFWSASGPRAYTVAGSLISWLKRTRGAKAVLDLYDGKSWVDATGSSAGENIAAWRLEIENSRDKALSEVTAEALFRHPGIMGEHCPHSRVDLAKPRSTGTLLRLRQPPGWNPERDLAPWLARLDPDSESQRFYEWRSAIDKLGRESFPPPAEIATWYGTVTNAQQWPPKLIEDIELRLLASDLAAVHGEHLERPESAPAASRQMLEELRAYHLEKRLSDGLGRQIGARWMIAEMSSPASGAPGILSFPEAREWRRFLAGWSKGNPPDSTLSPEPWLMTYLRMRRGGTEWRTPERLHDLLRAPLDDAMDGVGQSLVHAFQLEWFRMLAGHLSTADLPREAAEAWRRAEALAPAGRKPWHAEQARREEFLSRQGQ